MRKKIKTEFRMWIGVDPDDGTPLPDTLSHTRWECRSAMDSVCWGAGRTRRVTLTIEPPKKEKKHGK